MLKLLESTLLISITNLLVCWEKEVLLSLVWLLKMEVSHSMLRVLPHWTHCSVIWLEMRLNTRRLLNQFVLSSHLSPMTVEMRLCLSADKLFSTTKEKFTTLFVKEQSWMKNLSLPKPPNHPTSSGKTDTSLVPTTTLELPVSPVFPFSCFVLLSLLSSLSKRVRSN